MSIATLECENAELKAANAALKGENAELKAENLKLQAEVKLMRTIFHSLSEGVVASNLEGGFFVANPTAQEIAGMSPVEGAPEEWSETYGTFEPDKTTLVPSTELPLYKAMQGEGTDNVKLVLRNQNRPEGVFISVSGRPLYDETGSLVGGVIAMRDITELEQIREQLKATVNELQTQNTLMDVVFNSISDGVIVANTEGEFLLFNPFAEEIVGIGAVEETPEEWTDVYGTFEPDKVTPIPGTELPLSKAIRGEITNNVEVFIRNQNRPEGVFISVSGRPLYDKTGDLIGGVIAFHDVSQLKKDQEQLEAVVSDLQTQNSLMDAVFHSISDGIIVANNQGKYVLFNETVKNIVGQDIEDVHISQASERFGLFHPESQEPYPTDELPLSLALRGKRADNIEILIRNSQLPEEMNVSISARPVYDEMGIVNGAVAAIYDVTTIRMTEKRLQIANDQLKVQTQLLQSIFNGISDGVVVTGETSNVIMANVSARRMLGVLPFLKSSDEWFKPDLYFYPDKVTPIPLEEHPLFQAIQGKSTNNVEMFIQNEEVSDGIYVRVSGSPLQDREGNWTGGVAVFHDMTDRIKTEEALAQAFAQGRLEVVDTILHNIGNAINSVSVGIDIIHHQLTHDKLTLRLSALAKVVEQHQDDFSDYVKNDPQGQQVLPFLLTLAHDFTVVKEQWTATVQRIKDRSGHIVDIIRAQNSYNLTSGTHKDISLTAAISGAVRILQDSIDKRQIRIDIDCGSVPQEIRIQESQFHQMLVNLIKNSIEAIDELAESREGDEVPRIRFRAYIDGDFLCLDITDSGIGIPAENINKIFSSGFTTKKQGTGLGLHSSANFVISSGGKIQALSEGKGKGTTIQIKFRGDAIYQNAYQEST